MNDFEIIDLKIHTIDREAAEEIRAKVSKMNTTPVIDLRNVEGCVTEFFEVLKEFNKKIALVNVDSKILAALYITGYDRFVHVFEEIISLQSDKNEIINRRFSLV